LDRKTARVWGVEQEEFDLLFFSKVRLKIKLVKRQALVCERNPRIFLL